MISLRNRIFRNEELQTVLFFPKHKLWKKKLISIIILFYALIFKNVYIDSKINFGLQIRQGIQNLFW